MVSEDAWVHMVVKRDIATALYEAHVLKSLSHLSCVPSFMGRSAERIYVLPMSGYYSLASCPRALRSKEFYFIMKHLIRTILELHQGGWVHGNLSLENIYMNLEGDIRLMDWSYATKIGASHEYIMRNNAAYDTTPEYTTRGKPAAALYPKTVESSWEVFALGIVIRQLAYHKQPKGLELSPSKKQFIAHMLCQSPYKRPTLESLYASLPQ